MSYSNAVKTEILSKPRDTDALFCMIAGEILSAGSLVVANRKLSFLLTSENVKFLEAFKTQLQSAFQIDKRALKITGVDGAKTKYELTVGEIGADILRQLGITRFDKNGELEISPTLDRHLIVDDNCKKAFLAGAFVGAGSISVPTEGNKSGYHMEWVCTNIERAEDICAYLGELDIISKMIERGTSFVVYIKGSDAISLALGHLGAVASMLNLENKKVERAVRNNINRQSNCASANLDKTVSASVKQMQAIEQIDSTLGIDNLPANLYEVARARINNPEASLAELSEILGGNLTRVAVSLRLKKLIQIAKDLGENDG